MNTTQHHERPSTAIATTTTASCLPTSPPLSPTTPGTTHDRHIHHLESLRRQYFQLVPPTEIDAASIPATVLLSMCFQQSIYAELFDSRYNHDSAPPRRYTTRVLKRIITAIEEAAFAEGYGCPEINDELINYYAMLLSSSSPAFAPESRNNVTYTITPPPPSPIPQSLLQPPSLLSIPSPPTSTLNTISLLESRALISTSGHTGARTWEAALALGEILISPKTSTTAITTNTPPLTLHGTSVLELGAGTGFLSILSAKLGAEKVLATDGDWRVCSTLRENVQGNGVGRVVSVGRLLWGSGCGVESLEDWEEREGTGKEIDVDCGGDYDQGKEGKRERKGKHQEKGYIIPDLVLAADVTYDTSAIPSLVKEIRFILTSLNPRAIVLVAATVRNEETFESFLHQLENGEGSERCRLSWKIELCCPAHPKILYYPTTTPIRLIEISSGTCATYLPGVT